MSEYCSCLSISRDPLCVYHGDLDKIGSRLRAKVDELEQDVAIRERRILDYAKLCSRKDDQISALSDRIAAARAYCASPGPINAEDVLYILEPEADKVDA